MEVHIMFPALLIVLGILVLALGRRLAVLGGAVGALVGVVLLHFLSPSGAPLLQVAIVAGLAVAGFFLAGFAKGVVDIVLLVLGALGGAAIVLGFLDLFRATLGIWDWILAVAGGVVGLILVRRFKEWAMIVLAGLIGGLLVTRGLSDWLPIFQGALGTLLVIVLAGASIAYQGGLVGRRAVAETTAGGDSPPPPPAN
jgi:hypothetical protein